MDAELVGRDAELETVSAFVSAAGPGGLLIEGEAGIGKSSLWRYGVERARSSGATVLTARPLGEERSLAFSGLADLLDGVDAEIRAGLPEPQRFALEVALLERGTGDRPPDPRTSGTALLSILRTVAGDRPVLLAIDDLQWLDRSTLAALRFALRRLQGESVRWLATARSGFEWEVDAEVLVLAGLSPGALHELLHERLGVALTRLALLRLHEVSGGNPFMALELARSFDPDSPARTVPVPERVQRLLRERVGRLPARTREALLETAAAVEPVELTAALEPALTAGLVEVADGSVRFAHPLYGEAVYAAATPSRRRAAHGRLAGGSANPEARARHLALAGEGADETVAVALEAAAEEAAARGASATAAELAQLALVKTRDEGRRARRLLVAARCELLYGRRSAAAALVEEALVALPPGRERAEALLRRVETLAGDYSWGRELCAQAIAEADGDLRLVVRARLYAAASFIIEGPLGPALAELERAVEAARELGATRELQIAEASMTYAARLGGQRIEPPPTPNDPYEPAGVEFPARATRGIVLLLDNRLDEARATFEELAQLADVVGDEGHRGHVLMYLARVELQAGRYDLARRLAREALPQEPGQPLAVARWVLATAEAYAGRVEEARVAAAESLRLLREAGERWVQLGVLGLLGFLELSLGDASGAAELLRPLWPAEKELGRFEPAQCQVLPNTIHALLELGELEEARPLIEELEQCGRAVDNAWSLAQAARLRGLLAAGEADIETALAHFEAALREHERLPVPFEHARTLLALGATLRRARRKADARGTLEQALAIFEQLGTPLWAERTREELARIGGRRAGGSELTETEQRIAELVAEGRSNKEVAAALYVTVRTVESNLTRIYAKLGIRSRTELAHRLS